MSDLKKSEVKTCPRCDDFELKNLELEARNAELLKRVAQAKARESTIEDQIRAEYEKKMVDLKKSLTEGKAVDPYLKVQSSSPRGDFWAIGRKFTSEPAKIYVRDLTPAQILELEQTPKQFLSVTKVTHE